MASILVVDDDAQIRLFLRLVLETEGYHVLQASNGREGLRLLRIHAVDLIITDILMPDQDGFEVMMALRRVSPTMRIIAISGGSADVDYLDMAQKLGAHRTLKKPFTMHDLLGAIREEFRISSGHQDKDNAQH